MKYGVTGLGIALGVVATVVLGATLAEAAVTKNKLASNALSSTRLEAELAPAVMLSTPDGRDVYSYIVGCALPGSMTIEATVPGVPDSASPDTNQTCVNERCTSAGSLGLAQHWIDRRLEPKGQRWVSACLFARVNFHEEAEAISLRGLAPELTVSVDEAELFGVEEGAFFGNIFTDDDGPIDWNACRGEGQASGEFAALRCATVRSRTPAIPHTRCEDSTTRATAPISLRSSRAHTPARASTRRRGSTATVMPPRGMVIGPACEPIVRSSRLTSPRSETMRLRTTTSMTPVNTQGRQWTHVRRALCPTAPESLRKQPFGNGAVGDGIDGGGGGSRTRVRKRSAKGVYTLRRFVTSRLSPAEAASVGIEASLELFRRSAPGVPSGYPALSTP